MLCILALSFAAFAHRAAPFASAADADLSAYMLPDGSLPVLCIGGEATGDAAFPASICPFCVLAKSIVAPSCWAASVAAPLSERIRFANKAAVKPVTHVFAGLRSRGPPAGA